MKLFLFKHSLITPYQILLWKRSNSRYLDILLPHQLMEPNIATKSSYSKESLKVLAQRGRKKRTSKSQLSILSKTISISKNMSTKDNTWHKKWDHGWRIFNLLSRHIISKMSIFLKSNSTMLTFLEKALSQLFCLSNYIITMESSTIVTNQLKHNHMSMLQLRSQSPIHMNSSTKTAMDWLPLNLYNWFMHLKLASKLTIHHLIWWASLSSSHHW